MNLTQKLFPLGYTAIVSLAFFAAAPRATAQFAAYSTLTLVDHHTNSTNQNGNFSSTGFSVGALYDGHQRGSVSLGADVRGLVTSNDKFGLFGFRAALQPKKIHRDFVPVSPYAEMLVGGGTSSDTNSNHAAHMVYEGALGIDCLFTRHIEFRLLEVTVGRTPANNISGANSTGGDLWLISESSGLVYRF